jgi:hypothetical protein
MTRQSSRGGEEREMRFIQEFGFTVKVGQEEAYQRWLQKNEDAMAKSHPKGTRYLGTFVVIMGSEKQAGGYSTLVEFDNYGDMDKMAETMRDPKSAFVKFMRDGSAFIDTDLAAGWSQGLYKRVVDASILDPKNP